MGQKITELIEILDQLIALLSSEGEHHWQKKMRQSKDKIIHGNYNGIEDLLGSYGGMGSFNDLIICVSSHKGQPVFKENYKEKNHTLRILRDQAYELASLIKHSNERLQA